MEFQELAVDIARRDHVRLLVAMALLESDCPFTHTAAGRAADAILEARGAFLDDISSFGLRFGWRRGMEFCPFCQNDTCLAAVPPVYVGQLGHAIGKFLYTHGFVN